MFCPPSQRHNFPEPASGPVLAPEHSVAHTQIQQQHANVVLPPTLREILDAFSNDGNGDRELLLAILGAKKAEEDRLASQLACQSQIFILSQQYAQAQAQAQAQALYYHQYQQQLYLADSSAQQMQADAQPTNEARQATSPTESPAISLPSPSSSSSSSSSSIEPVDSLRYNPYRRASSHSDLDGSAQFAPLASTSTSAGPILFRTDKLAKIHSTLRNRRRSSSAASVVSLSTEIPTVISATVTAPSPSASVTSPPMNPRTPPAMPSSAGKRVLLTDLLSSSESTKPATRESFVRGTPTDGDPAEFDGDYDDEDHK